MVINLLDKCLVESDHIGYSIISGVLRCDVPFALSKSFNSAVSMKSVVVCKIHDYSSVHFGNGLDFLLHNSSHHSDDIFYAKQHRVHKFIKKFVGSLLRNELNVLYIIVIDSYFRLTCGVRRVFNSFIESNFALCPVRAVTV